MAWVERHHSPSPPSARHPRPPGATVNVGVDPSKVQITKLKVDKDRKALLERKRGAAADKGKFSEAEVQVRGPCSPQAGGGLLQHAGGHGLCVGKQVQHGMQQLEACQAAREVAWMALFQLRI